MQQRMQQRPELRYRYSTVNTSPLNPKSRQQWRGVAATLARSFFMGPSPLHLTHRDYKKCQYDLTIRIPAFEARRRCYVDLGINISLGVRGYDVEVVEP